MKVCGTGLSGRWRGLERAALASGVAGSVAAFLLAAVAAALLARGDEPPRPQTQPGAQAPVQAATPPSPAAVAAMVQKLGDSSWRTREEAQSELIAVGAPAVGELEKALRSDDAEIRQRCESILQTVRKSMLEGASQAASKARLWRSPVKEGVASAASASGGVVCFVASDGTLRAVDANTGKELWTFADLSKEADAQKGNRIVTLPASFPAPLIEGGVVYVSSQFGRAYAIDLARGELKWKTPAADGFAPPAFGGGKVYVAGAQKDVRALDAASGKELWQCDLPGGSTVRPVVLGPAVYVAARDGAIYALDANSGAKKALAADLADVTDLLSGKDGSLVARTADAVACLDAASGKPKWSYPLAGAQAGGGITVMANGIAQGQVMAANARPAGNPNANANAPLRQQGDNTVLAAGDALYTASGGLVHAIDAGSGRLLWTYKPELKDSEAGAGGAGGVVNIQVVGGGAVVMGGGGRFIMRSGGGGGLSIPWIESGTMYVASPVGLHAVDLKTRQELWRLESNEVIAARPIVIGGVLYYGTADLSTAGAGGIVMMNVNGGQGLVVQQRVAIAQAQVAQQKLAIAQAQANAAAQGQAGAVVVAGAPAAAPGAAANPAAANPAGVQPDETGPALHAIRLKAAEGK
jgi:outer membrane protein assembly factor BamB